MYGAIQIISPEIARNNLVFYDGRKYSAVDNFVFQDGWKYSAADNFVFQDGWKYSAADNFVFQDGRKCLAVNKVLRITLFSKMAGNTVQCSP